MEKHSLLIPVTVGITKSQIINWATQLTNYFGSKNINFDPDQNQLFFIINHDITEDDVKFSEHILSSICKNTCDVMCIRGTEESWDKATENNDLLIFDI